VTKAITGLPNEIFNVVLRCRLAPHDAEDAIDGAIDEFRKRRIPMLWHVGLLTQPRDLGKLLEERGFPRDYDLRAMAASSGIMTGADLESGDVRIEAVSSEEQSLQWIRCLASSWHLPEEVYLWMAGNPCFNTELERRNGIQLGRKMYLGLVSDTPVSASMLFWGNGIAGLQAVGTIPSAQGRGAGAAVVMAAVKDARAMGFMNVVVLSTVEGERLYEKLGFKRFGELPEHSMHFER